MLYSLKLWTKVSKPRLLRHDTRRLFGRDRHYAPLGSQVLRELTQGILTKQRQKGNSEVADKREIWRKQNELARKPIPHPEVPESIKNYKYIIRNVQYKAVDLQIMMPMLKTNREVAKAFRSEFLNMDKVSQDFFRQTIFCQINNLLENTISATYLRVVLATSCSGEKLALLRSLEDHDFCALCVSSCRFEFMTVVLDFGDAHHKDLMMQSIHSQVFGMLSHQTGTAIIKRSLNECTETQRLEMLENMVHPNSDNNELLRKFAQKIAPGQVIEDSELAWFVYARNFCGVTVTREICQREAQEHIDAIYEYVRPNVVELALHKTGHLVVYKLLLHCSIAQRRGIVWKLCNLSPESLDSLPAVDAPHSAVDSDLKRHAGWLALFTSQYGIVIGKALLEVACEDHRVEIYDIIATLLVDLSRDLYGSEIVEYYIEHANSTQMKRLFRHCIFRVHEEDTPPVVWMADTHHGRTTLKRLLTLAEGDNKEFLSKQLKQHQIRLV